MKNCTKGHEKSMRIEEGDYGPVVVIAGVNKGRIGIYDDDDYESSKTKASVVFGNFLICEKEAIIPYENLRTVTTKALFDRINEIVREIRENKDKIQFKYDRLCEYELCSNLLYERYINARECMKNQEKHSILYLTRAKTYTSQEL